MTRAPTFRRPQCSCPPNLLGPERAKRRLIRVIMALISAAMLAVSVEPAWSQGQGTGSTSSTGQGSGGPQDTQGQQGGAAAPGSAIAQVGAGTTSETTTGYSEPKSAQAKEPGENSLPPLPSAELCKDYQGTDVYRHCIATVLGKE